MNRRKFLTTIAQLAGGAAAFTVAPKMIISTVAASAVGDTPLPQGELLMADDWVWKIFDMLDSLGVTLDTAVKDQLRAVILTEVSSPSVAAPETPAPRPPAPLPESAPPAEFLSPVAAPLPDVDELPNGIDPIYEYYCDMAALAYEKGQQLELFPKYLSELH